MSEISKWYSGQCIFVTGATGFLGKVLLEKLLRSCPDIVTIYVLMREKKNISAEERLKTILNEPLFDSLREENLNVFNKIVAIKGDLELQGLGIDSKQRAKLIEKVSIIYHSAATIRFTEPLKDAIRMNICGTQEVINLAYELKNLQVFVHVSTAYSNCNLKHVQEKLYKPPMEYRDLKQLTEILDDSQINHLTPKLLKGWPNTYTFTKAITEQIIEENVRNKELPVVIIRPAIVSASCNEPIPGWVDNINGLTGVLLAGGTGILRSVYSHPHKVTCLIPVDFVINLMISAAWHFANKKCISMPIYNHSMGVINPITNIKMQNICHDIAYKYPFEKCFWPPNCPGTSNYLNYQIISFLTRVIPAYIIDIVCKLMCKKPMAVKLSNKIDEMMETYKFFCYEEWRFHTQNVPKLLDDMSEEDKKTFNFDVNTINWNEYFTHYYIGVKKYIMKEKMENLPKAKIHLKRLTIAYYVSWFILILLLLLFCRYILNWLL